MAGAVPFGCGQCLPCRIQRRRLWQWRMFYESQLHTDNCFVTLTYDQDHYPSNGSLSVRDYQLWLKRLRKSSGVRFRYFVVGEYGDQTFRPHYHGCLFGIGPLHKRFIESAWGKGFVHVDDFNHVTAQYTAGYVLKKLTDEKDPRLEGRFPEFARMSLRPGIGAGAMAMLADALGTDHGLNELLKTGDVPQYLQMGKKKIPIGRYLREKLRQEIGMPKHVSQAAKDAASHKRALELQALHADKEVSTEKYKVVTRKSLLSAWEGKINNVEGRSRIWKKRSTL